MNADILSGIAADVIELKTDSKATARALEHIEKSIDGIRTDLKTSLDVRPTRNEMVEAISASSWRDKAWLRGLFITILLAVVGAAGTIIWYLSGPFFTEMQKLMKGG